MSTNQERSKRWLLAGIILFGGISVYLHIHLKNKRVDEMHARDNAPLNRAKRAIQDADRATVNGDMPRARLYLVKAREALEEAIQVGPKTRQLLHNRLVMIRRQLHLADQAKRHGEAIQFGRTALEQARTLFKGDRTDSRSRADRLATSRELASLPTLDPAEAARVLHSAATDVDETHKKLPTTEVVRMQLAKTWLEAARWATEGKQRVQALAAASRALELVRVPSQNDDPINRLSTAYVIGTTAAELAEKLDAKAAQLRFENAAIEVMKARLKLQPLKPTLPQGLASRLSRLADIYTALKQHPQALKAQTEATEVLERALSDHPQNPQVAWSYVRCLNLLGALHSARDEDKKSLASYKRAYEHLRTLPDEAGRTRVITMGNYAQLLGRLDRMKRARQVAQEAYDLALQFGDRDKSARRQVEDTASAGLRLARLLRAKPNIKRRQALTVAQREAKRLGEIGPYESKRKNQIERGLKNLIEELR
ncbi:MAG: tetratricopeptide repeat protein [Myxococcota bacterium]|nr:tetratricopeptide repeat protein [Myxococcota bacterium]